MFNYFRSIWRIIRLSISIVGAPWYLFTIAIGLVSRLALLACFISVIKIVVWALASGRDTVVIPLTDQTWDLMRLLDASLLAIPLMFALAGCSLFLSEKCSRFVSTKILNEARARHIREHTLGLMTTPGAKRKAEIKTFLNRAEPDFAKAVTELTKGPRDLIQAMIIMLLVCTVLAYQNVIVFYCVVAIAAVLVPGYVRRNYLQFIEFKKKAGTLRQIRADEFATVVESEQLISDDPDVVIAQVQKIVNGEADKVQQELEETRIMGPRKIYPIIYGALGTILSVLLWDMISDGLPIESSLLGRFVISAILLRFFVGELGFALTALRQINSEYVVSRKLLDLFNQPVPGPLSEGSDQR